MLVLFEDVKNIRKLEVDLTIEEKKCLEKVHENLLNEAIRIVKPLKDMDIGSEETFILDDDEEMIKWYLEDNLIDCHKICKEIETLGVCHVRD